MEEVLKIQYFGIEYVEKIHDEQIINYGKNGLVGYKDKGQLESVLFNIQNDLYYPTFIDKLTHLFYCTCQFHCFADGNKRLALSLSTQFLLLNGYLKIASRFIVDMENISYHVAAGKISKEFLHEIFESYFNGTFESEEMKLKIYEAISENSLVEV